MADSIEGRAALVTGASSGLGRHMALSLARGGAHVALTARRIGRLESLAEEIAAFGGRAVPIALDVTDAASVAAGVAAAEDALGALTILVNNAGIAEAKWLLDHDERAFDRIMDTNLKGAWLVATEVGRRMIRHEQGGAIVNVSSTAAVQATPGSEPYGAAKAGINSLTLSLARAYAPKVRVN